jgi:hypothetical protein
MTGAEVRGRDRRLLLAMALAAVGALWLVAAFVVLPGGEGWGYDYRAYADAAQRLAETGTLYQDETLSGPYRPGPYGLYMYAPPLGLAVGPLAGLELEAAVGLWFLLHVAALAGACLLMPVEAWIRLTVFGLAALSFAVLRDLALGNVSVLLLLPLAVTWRWLDRPVGSVAQALAMAIRPMLGVMLVWQLLRRRWQALAWTLASGVTLGLLTLPFVGLAGYGDYVVVLRNLTDVTGVEHNLDLGSLALGLGAGPSVASLFLVAGYAMAAAAVGLSLRRDPETGFHVCVTASLLLSPLLWDHYLAMLVLPAAFLAQRGRPWALALPLLSWLPDAFLPLVVAVGVWLPFLARPLVIRGPRASTTPPLAVAA